MEQYGANRPWWFFTLARYNPGGPTYYGGDVRMPADRYLTRTVMGIIATALTMLVILVIVLPIIKQRIHSFMTAINCIGIGMTVSLCLVSPSWLRGYAQVESSLDYFSTQDRVMKVGLHVGLASINITLEDSILNSTSEHNYTTSSGFFYNEKLNMFKPEELEPSLDRALKAGLPIPLLTVMHFMTSATLEFHGSQDIMESGYHCYLCLTFAMFVWIFALLFTACLPRYSCYAFIIIGALMIATNVIYFFWTELDHNFPSIVISGKFIQLRYGICFWICLIVGVWSHLFGYSLSVYDLTHPDKFLTIFDIDYDQKRNILATLHRQSLSPEDNDWNADESAVYIHPNVAY